MQFALEALVSDYRALRRDEASACMAVKSDGEQCSRAAVSATERYGYEIRLCSQHSSSLNNRAPGRRYGKVSQ